MKLPVNPEWVRYNDLYNEGGEGYNPHPKYIESTAPEPLWSILSDKIARLTRVLNGTSESDPLFAKWSAERSALQAQLDAERRRESAQEADTFASVWTAEVLEKRRAEWNSRIKPYVDAGKSISTAELVAIQRDLGYTIDDIKRAKALHQGATNQASAPKDLPSSPPPMRAVQSAAPALKAPVSGADPLVKGLDGNMIRTSELRRKLADDLARLPKITNAYGIEIVQRSIDHAKKILGE